MSIILFLFLSVPTQKAEAASSERGTEIYEVLHKKNFLDNYMVDKVEEISQTLVSASGQWSDVRVNKPYSKSAINIYLIDSEKLPEANILEPYGVKLNKGSFQGNALAHEATNILFVDTVLIKSLITVAQMSTDQGNDLIYATAKIKAYGVENFRQLWDPKMNSKLAMAWHSDNGLLLASGSLAFIMAHEIGHIAIGTKTSAASRSWIRYKGKDSDRRWACSNLVEKKYQHQQMIEQEADDYAVMLLSKILFPPGVMHKPLFRYELGARWYMTYNLSLQIVASLYATEDSFIHSDMRQEFGAEMYNLLISKEEKHGRGLVKVYFPKNHPANIRRTSVSLNKLAQSQYSWYQGESSVDSGIKIFEMFLDRQCQKIKPKPKHGK